MVRLYLDNTKFCRYILLWESPVDWFFCCSQPGNIWRAVVLENSLPPPLREFVLSDNLRPHTKCWQTAAQAPRVLYIPAANQVDNTMRLGKDHYLSIGDRQNSIELIPPSSFNCESFYWSTLPHFLSGTHMPVGLRKEKKMDQRLAAKCWKVGNERPGWSRTPHPKTLRNVALLRYGA